MGLIVLGASALFFIVALIFSAKTWRWHHLTALFFVFVGAVGFMWLAARSLKARSAWLQVYEANVKMKEKVEAEGVRLAMGNPTDIDPEPSVRSERETLHRLLLRRGRVWRGCTLGSHGAAGPFYQLQLTTQPDAAGNSPSPGFEVNAGGRRGQIVYCFMEHVLQDGNLIVQQNALLKGFSIPRFFVGEFSVTAINAAQVTLQSTTPLSPALVQLMAQNLKWTMYEHMPNDSHSAFTDELSTEAAYFGTPNEALLTMLFNDKLDAKKVNIPTVVKEFTDDGKQEKDEASRLAANVWWKVRFTKKHVIQVDSGQSPDLASPDFDSTGLARNPQLKNGGPVTLNAGEEVIMLKSRADSLVNLGVCEKLGAYYVRSLRDYRYLLTENVRIFEDLRYKDMRVTKKLADKRKLLSASQTLYAKLQRDSANLKDDELKYKAAETAIIGYRRRMEGVRDGFLQQLKVLYDANQSLAKALAVIQKQATDEINRRTTAAATAGN